MTDVEFTPLGDAAATALGHVADADLSRLTQVTVELTVEVGRTRMQLGETMSLGPGSVVTLERLADKPVAPNDTAAGRGLNRRVEILVPRTGGLGSDTTKIPSIRPDLTPSRSTP